MRDLISNVKTVHHYIASQSSTKTPATGVDIAGFRSVLVQVTQGPPANVANSPSPKWSYALEESDSASTGFTAVAEADMILANGRNVGEGGVSNGIFAVVDTAAKDDTTYTVGYIGAKRYLRVTATPANTPGATDMSVTLVLGGPNLAPVADV